MQGWGLGWEGFALAREVEVAIPGRESRGEVLMVLMVRVSRPCQSTYLPQSPHLKSDQRKSTRTDKLDPLPVDSLLKIIAVKLESPFTGHLLWVLISFS